MTDGGVGRLQCSNTNQLSLFDFCNRACYSHFTLLIRYTPASYIPMRPSIALDLNRNAIRKMVSRFRATNLRVFGSVLHGTDKEDSDLDLLVDTLPGATLFDLGELQVELEELLGVNVDLLTTGDLPQKFRDQVVDEARPV